jgi:hypothetical protein
MIFGLGKPTICERCGKTLEKKQVNFFDSTIRGARQDGETLKLCSNCLMEKFTESLARFKFRAIVVYPTVDRGWFSKTNAYHFFTWEEMREIRGYSSDGEANRWPEDYIASLTGLLPPAGTPCSLCGDTASFTWVSPEIYFNDWSSAKVNTEGRYEKTFVCRKCLLHEFRKKTRENNLIFDEFLPPTDGDGFGTPTES